MAEDCTALEETLAIAQTVLSDLERKEAGYTSLTMPSHLSIELKDKRREVENLKARLETAQLAREKAQQSSQSDVNLHSSIRSRVADEYYIERKEAKRLLGKFADVIKQPDGQPLLFNICGIGGVGKTTLLGRLKDAHVNEVDFLEVCFAKKRDSIETPLKLMRKLHQQAIDRFGGQAIPDSFTQQEGLFENTLFELSQKSLDGEATSNEEATKIISWFERSVWLGARGLTFTANKSKSFNTSELEFSALSGIGDDTESWQELMQQRVRNHPATKDQPELKSLMLEPVSKLTQAFAESMMQISRNRGRSLVLILDTFEKAQPYLNQWLWQYLVEDTTLYSSSVRLVVVGRRSLQVDEGWRKLNQDRKLLYDSPLNKFSRPETENYLKKIGIDKDITITKIFNATHGLPYYLDWVRKQREQGIEPNFSKGNKEIVDFLLEELDTRQRKVLQVMSCCRWFDLSVVRYLIIRSDYLGLEQDIENAENYFEWLKLSDFVEFANEHYCLDDVARDVFRQYYFRNDKTQFRKTNALLADYFNQQANEIVDPQSPLPDPYKDQEWREMTSEVLYYSIFGKGKEGLQKYIEHIFVAVYLQEPDVFISPFAFICAEISEEHQNLLPHETDKFFKDSEMALNFGWRYLNIQPSNYKINFEGEKIPSEKEIELFSKQIEMSIQSLLGHVGDLHDNLGKCVGLVYKSLRCNDSKESENLLLQAKRLSEQLQNYCRPKLMHSILVWFALLLKITENHEDSLICYQKALDLYQDNTFAFLGYGIALLYFKRYEEALESFQKASKLDPKSIDAWMGCGAILHNDLNRYEEALENFQKVIDLDPKSINAWISRSIALRVLERYEESLESFQKVIELDPKSIDAWINHGYILRFLERYEEVPESFQKVIELDPNSIDAWINQGITLFLLERYEEALESFQKVIDRTSQSAIAWANRGHILREMKRYKEAIFACDQACEIDSNSSEALNAQALTLSLVGDFEKAITAIDKAIELGIHVVINRANRGIILARAGRYLEALEECEQAIKQDPNHESGYYGKACWYALQGDIDLAIENLRKSIDIASRNSRREAKHNPDFDGIRDDERFRALVYPKT